MTKTAAAIASLFRAPQNRAHAMRALTGGD
jgi:hypothetical protein